VAFVTNQDPFSYRPGVATPSPFQSAIRGVPPPGGIDITVVVAWLPGAVVHIVQRPLLEEPAAGTPSGRKEPPFARGSASWGSGGAGMTDGR
jgi:hypothetical protein